MLSSPWLNWTISALILSTILAINNISFAAFLTNYNFLFSCWLILKKRGNKIGDIGAKNIAEAIKNMTHLTNLSLNFEYTISH
jgi:hypothetical protein